MSLLENIPPLPFFTRSFIHLRASNFHFIAVTTIYGIELLNANEQLKRADMGKLLVVNEATGKEVDVPLSV